MEGITPHEILLNMFTHFSIISSRISAIVTVGVKRILFSPQDIEQKISRFNEKFSCTKEYSTLYVICKMLTHHLKTALNATFLHILGRLKANPPLNNVNCVKCAIFENYFGSSDKCVVFVM